MVQEVTVSLSVDVKTIPIAASSVVKLAVEEGSSDVGSAVDGPSAVSDGKFEEESDENSVEESDE